MVGQPGTGKTLLAKAIAGEAKVPFFSISGSDFVEMFVGVGASRVRDMFEQAKKQAPCIIFIDEIDAVGRHRGAGLGGGHDEREQTLNQLLVEMDGFEPNDGIIVIAATNRPDVLDPALLRPGRFDRQVVVGLPDIRGREQILKVHMRKVPLADDVDPAIIARGTPGFSGADLANLVNEAALFAARAGKRLVDMDQFDKAKDKIMMGAERKSMVMSEKEKRNTAYHEAGHAIVGRLVPDHDPVYKVTIIPRGRALGVTMFLPEEDRYSFSRQTIMSQICSLFGGRIAEEMILGPEYVTTGASNDIERATQLARNMVTKWGLSQKLGPIQYDDDDGEPFLGHVRRSAAEALLRRHGPGHRRRGALGDRPVLRHGQAAAQGERGQAAHDGGCVGGVRNHHRRADRRHHGRRQATGAGRHPAASDLGQGHAAAPARASRARRRSAVRPKSTDRRTRSALDQGRVLQCRQRRLDLSRPAIMGVINVTPDSFSDGGRWSAGARTCPVSSTRPTPCWRTVRAFWMSEGSPPAPVRSPCIGDVESRRVMPVIEKRCSSSMPWYPSIPASPP